MKAKTKTTSARARRTTGARRKKDAHYPAYYLAVVLGAVLLLEGFMLGAAAPVDWQDGLEVLDISGGVEQAMGSLSMVAAPMMDQVGYIEDFYQLAAVEMALLLDFSDNDLTVLPKAAAQFYRLAKVEVATMLDASDAFEYWPQVAGASFSR